MGSEKERVLEVLEDEPGPYATVDLWRPCGRNADGELLNAALAQGWKFLSAFDVGEDGQGDRVRLVFVRDDR